MSKGEWDYLTKVARTRASYFGERMAIYGVRWKDIAGHVRGWHYIVVSAQAAKQLRQVHHRGR